jgi:hypothetical protein
MMWFDELLNTFYDHTNDTVLGTSCCEWVRHIDIIINNNKWLYIWYHQINTSHRNRIDTSHRSRIDTSHRNRNVYEWNTIVIIRQSTRLDYYIIDNVADARDSDRRLYTGHLSKLPDICTNGEAGWRVFLCLLSPPPLVARSLSRSLVAFYFGHEFKINKMCAAGMYTPSIYIRSADAQSRHRGLLHSLLYQPTTSSLSSLS